MVYGVIITHLAGKINLNGLDADILRTGRHGEAVKRGWMILAVIEVFDGGVSSGKAGLKARI